MASFDALDWSRLDVCAIVTFGGLATIAPKDRDGTRDWLLAEGYTIDTIDGSQGLASAVESFSRLMRWEEQFGYAMSYPNANLDALRDGFDFDATECVGRVLEVLRADLLWQEDEPFVRGWLSIACEHSHERLAQGQRFFTALVIPEDARLLRGPIACTEVPMWWRARYR